MSKLSDVQYATQGEVVEQAKQASNVSEQSIVSDMKIQNETASTTEIHIFKLANHNRNGGVYISGECDMLNPKTGRVERARLLSGVESIWMKEQKDITPDYVTSNLRTLHFARGTRMLRVWDWDKSALEFIRLNPNNIGSKSHKSGGKMEFYEYDPAKEERESNLEAVCKAFLKRDIRKRRF